MSDEEHAPSRRGLVELAIDRPVTVIVGVILTVLFGAASILALPIQLTPDVEVPTLTVRTTWPGATPQEVERELLEDQEEVLKSVQGLDRMVSEARPNSGSVTLEFEVGTDLDEALVRVSNQLQQISSAPESAREPTVATANSSGPPLAVIIIRSRTPGEPVEAYRTWVAEEIIPALERIKGVADVRHLGGRDAEIHVDFDPHELAARGVSIERARGPAARRAQGPLGRRRHPRQAPRARAHGARARARRGARVVGAPHGPRPRARASG